MEAKAYSKKIQVDAQGNIISYGRPSCIKPDTCFGIYSTKDSKLTIPLKDIKFQVNIKDCLSEVEILQIYVNSNKKAVECEYVFPIDPLTTAVTGLTVTVDDKVIEATVLEKEKASEKYSDAIARGNTAFKMNQDEQQPDIIKIAIGNLLSGAEVIIVTRYVKLMEVENGSWSFRIPLAYAPRYNNSGIPAHSSGGLDPEFVEGSKLPYKWHLDMEINSSKSITRLASPTHKLDIEFGNSNRKAHVTLANNNEVPNTDLIIFYKTENFSTPSAILQKAPEYDCYAALISFCPKFEDGVSEDTEVDGSGEYIFVLDCSGSMRGERIRLAKTALEMFLRSLPVDSKFNIVCFGSNYKFFEEGMIKYTPENLEKALSYLKKIDANMGGTEIDTALTAIFSIPVDPFYPRSLFLLTDGDVSNPNSVINLIKKNAYNTRVHAFGIGSGASRYLVKNCALTGKGDSQFVVEGEDLTPKVVASLRKATLGACTNAKLVWPSGINVELQNTPKDHISNVYLNEPFVVLALLKGDVEGKKVKLKYKETVNHNEVELEIVLPDKPITGKDVYQAVVKDAFEKNTELQKKEIIGLSVKYSVLSEETAFIAIQRNKGKAGGSMESIKIPIAIAKDSGVQEIEPMFLGSYAMPNIMCYGAPMGAMGSSNFNIGASGLLYGSKKYGSSKGSERGKKFDESHAFREKCGTKVKSAGKSKYEGSNISYMEIIAKQELYGNWKWDKTTLSVIGVAEDKAGGNIPEELKVQFNDVKILREVWITILTLVKLEIDYASSKESWQLVFKKAVQWLKNSGINYAKYKPAGEKVIH